jgi:RNA polymerase sigma-54 factor
MARLGLSARLEMRASPALLSLARLLELPSLSLHQVVQEELAANPALEEIAYDGRCRACGGPAAADLCLRCSRELVQGPGLGSDEERWLVVASPLSPIDALLADLRASLPAADHDIALALVGNLDERGFLREQPAAIARTLGVSRARVDVVLALLRGLGPPGIGTSGPRECLLAQLDALGTAGVTCPHAREIVANHLDDLGFHRHHLIARRLGITMGDVERARDFLQRKLWPHPLAVTEQSLHPDTRHYWIVDVVIEWDGDHPRVELRDSTSRGLRLNPIYQQLAREPDLLEVDERAHVLDHVNRARLFLRSLRQRQLTLQHVAGAVALRQEAFLRHGIKHLVPLARVDIARELDLHHSTVSRAVQNKVAQLPDRTLWPMERFFEGSRVATEALRELIMERGHQLSDQELAEALAERGVNVARRTVTKYRRQLGIASRRNRAKLHP